jgi:hypothetical protein
MAELKTKQNNLSVDKFLKNVKDESTRKDCYAIIDIMKKITKEEPKMWGPSIIGFGKYHYKYASGHEGDMCIAGFSPRKQNLTIYIMPGFDRYPDLMKNLGKFKTGKSCLYFKKLEDIEINVLKKLITESVKNTKKRYEGV